MTGKTGRLWCLSPLRTEGDTAQDMLVDASLGGQPKRLSLRQFFDSRSQLFCRWDRCWYPAAEVHLGRLRTAFYMSFFSEIEFSAENC